MCPSGAATYFSTVKQTLKHKTKVIALPEPCVVFFPEYKSNLKQ